MLPDHLEPEKATTSDNSNGDDYDRSTAADAVNGPPPPQTSPLDRRILMKLDFLIIPMVTIVYLLAFLDRANIGNARVVSTPPLTITDLGVLTMLLISRLVCS